jgi:hypothetical protein
MTVTVHDSVWNLHAIISHVRHAILFVVPEYMVDHGMHGAARPLHHLFKRTPKLV